MLTPRHLRNAPIREALIDIAAKLPKPVDVSVLRALTEQVKPDYSKAQELQEAGLELVLSREHNQITQRHKPLGYRRQSEDGRRIVQFRLNGFTYNWLRPYGTWEELRDNARRYWAIYAAEAKPASVARVTLRYVNNLELPFPLVDFSQYLNAPPNLPAELPLKVTRFLSRVSVVRESSSASAVITQAFEGLPGAGAKHVNVILDIDTSKREDFGNDDGVWAALEELHTFKNEIFFSSLTEAAVRLYE